VKQRRLSREVALRQAEIKALQSQLETLARSRGGDAEQADRRRLEDMRKRIAEVETRLTEEQRKFAPPEQIGPMLEPMLSRNRRLTLVDMRTRPAAALGGSEKPAAEKPGTDKAAASKPLSTGSGLIYRHGVEFTVTGTYLDLLAYLKDLE